MCHGVGLVVLICVCSCLSSCLRGYSDVSTLVCVGRKVEVHQNEWVCLFVCVVQMGKSGRYQLDGHPCVCDKSCIHV